MSFQAREVAEYIKVWLESYVSGAGMDGFVVGVSGGIDSAVTSALCCLTGRPVFVVDMPIHQSARELGRSRELCEMLGSRFSNVVKLEVPLSDVYESFKSSVPEFLDVSGGLALANSRARLRMTTLYCLAAQRRALVVGTGNKVEDFGVGFYTKYGDGGVDLSPIADLMKSEVYLLGHELGVPRSILEAAPTDGLWGDDRNDEDQIGATYDELEFAMKFVERNGDTELLSPRQFEVHEIFSKLHKANRHKMDPIPICEIPHSLL